MEHIIEIANIEEELQKLWRSQVFGNQLKAGLFNLVIYSHEARRTEYLKEMIRNFILKFPCRIIFIDHKKEAHPEQIKVSVSDRLKGADDTVAYCDQIYIEVTSAFIHRVPYIILPHFIPDLPIYLLWGQDPVYEHEILPEIEEYAVRLIYDSECNHNLKIFSTKILEKMRKSNLEFMDVSWGLITGWRDALAVCYDSEEQVIVLHSADTIQITYNAVLEDKIFHAERQAIYFQAWIASEMEWTFVETRKENDRNIISYNNGEKNITVTLIPSHHKDLPVGQLVSVEILSDVEEISLKIQDSNPSRIIVTASTKDRCDLPFVITVADSRRGTGIMKELFFQRPSPRYKKMLTYLSHIDFDVY